MEVNVCMNKVVVSDMLSSPMMVGHGSGSTVNIRFSSGSIMVRTLSPEQEVN